MCLAGLLLILRDAELVSGSANSKISVVSEDNVGGNSRFRYQQATQDHQFQSQQEQMKSDDYEKLSKDEERVINNYRVRDQTPTKVIPSKDTNSNSQVVFVNLDRVVNDESKNESTKVIDNNAQYIKQDGQISCGETNRNGKPSMANTTSDSLQNRIVGGTKADPGEFPYQVRLNIRSRRGSSLCGGVIIDQRHILTAAHCMTTW